MLPATYAIVEALPLTPSGKLSRNNLPDPNEAAPRSIAGSVPRTPVEIALARLWSEILEVDSVGVQDNFFELGGALVAGHARCLADQGRVWSRSACPPYVR